MTGYTPHTPTDRIKQSAEKVYADLVNGVNLRKSLDFHKLAYSTFRTWLIWSKRKVPKHPTTGETMIKRRGFKTNKSNRNLGILKINEH